MSIGRLSDAQLAEILRVIEPLEIQEIEWTPILESLALEIQRWRLVEPMISEHLKQLRMDTDEDNRLLAVMRATWEVVARSGHDDS